MVTTGIVVTSLEPWTAYTLLTNTLLNTGLWYTSGYESYLPWKARFPLPLQRRYGWPIGICIQVCLFRGKVFSTSQNYTAYLYLINTATYDSHWDTCQVGQPSVRHFHSWYKVHPGTSPHLVRSGHSVDLWQLGWKEEWRKREREGGRDGRRKGGRKGGRKRGRNANIK